MDDENEESSSFLDGSESPDLDNEWRNWRVDDPELESDVAAEEGIRRKGGRIGKVDLDDERGNWRVG